MHLTVRSRIAIAMAAVMLTSAVGLTLTWSSYSSASRYAADAATATSIARDNEELATRLTQFVSDSRAIAYTLHRSAASEDSSVIYGRLLGSEKDVDHAIDVLESRGVDVARTRSEWDALRETTYLWINRESAAARRPLRMTFDDAGEYRASTSTILEESAQLAALSDVAFTRHVRDLSEVLKNGTVRLIAREAQATATVARAAEERARQQAAMTAGLLGVFNLLVAVGAAVWLYRSIALPLADARAFADRVASGDLTATFGTHRSDEIGALTREVEEMKDVVVGKIDTMREVAGVVLVTAESVREAVDGQDDARASSGADLLISLTGQLLES